MLNNDELEKLLRDRMEDFEATPPLGGWEKIKKDIQEPEEPKFFWWPVAATLLLLILSLIPASKYFLQRQPADTIQAGNKITSTESELHIEQALTQRNNNNAAPGIQRKPEIQEHKSEQITIPDQSNKLSDNKAIKHLKNNSQNSKAALSEANNVETTDKRRSTSLITDKYRKAGSHVAIMIIPAGRAKEASNKLVKQDKASNADKTADFIEVEPNQIGSLDKIERAASKSDIIPASSSEPDEVIAMQRLKIQIDTLGEKLVIPADTLAALKSENEEVIIKKKVRAYRLSAFVSPRYTYRRFVPNDNDNIMVLAVSGGNSAKERLGFEAGLMVHKQWSKKVDWYAGVSALCFRETMQITASNGEVESYKYALTAEGKTLATPLLKKQIRKYESSYLYTGLNTGLYWRLFGGLYATGGGGINLLLKGKTIISDQEENIDEIYFPSPDNPFEQVNFRFSGGLGYTWKLLPGIDIAAEPSVHYFMGSTFKKREPLGIRPYSFGLNVGLRF